MFGIKKSKINKNDLKNKFFFDISIFLEANPQIEQEITNNNYESLEDYFKKVDIIKALENGLMKFHKLYEPFDEQQYIDLFPDVEIEISQGNFLSAFEHFKYFGYEEIIANTRIWKKVVTENDYKIVFHIDHVDNFFIGGWILDENHLNKEIILALYIDDKYINQTINTIDREDILSIYGISSVGFNIDIPIEYRNTKSLKIDLKILIEDKIITFMDKSILWSSLDSLIDVCTKIQKSLNNNNNISATILRRDILPSMIDNIRAGYDRNLSEKKDIFQKQNFLYDVNHDIEKTIDIIVPIYRDVLMTRNCIDSILNAKNEIKYQLILINDYSPDIDMSSMLKTYLSYDNVVLLENNENLGYIATVNRGIDLHNNRDVILLNSDTIVTDYWIDKLTNTAYSNHNIATVTPLSNNATILSYPVTLVNNKIPKNFSTESLNKICSKVNKGIIVDLPTAHGFCMFVKRVVVSEIGSFNEERYGRGYAEENEFSLRASTYGWRNVAACDTFIQHVGSVSFSDSKDQLIENNLKILNKLYPEYSSLVTDFIEKDPLYIARRNISKEIYKILNKKYMLFIMHTLGGGTEIAANDLSQLLKKKNKSVLILECDNKKYILRSYDQVFQLEYRFDEWSLLLDDLKELCIWHIHFHHILEFNWKILNLANHLNIKYDFTVHDYFVICPRINLTDEQNVYCNEPDIEVCNKCIEFNDIHVDVRYKYETVEKNIEQWRNKFYLFMKKARIIFVPNEDVYTRLNNYYNFDNLTIKAHPEKEKRIVFQNVSYADGRVKVAVLGAVNENKGFFRLKECIHHAWKYDLPIDFIIIGYTCNDVALSTYDNVVIVGQYHRKDLKKLVTKYQCNLALFLSVWPETFSYTFSEALENKLYPISYDIGAISKRIKYYGFGETISLDTTANDLNELILSIPSRETNKVLKVGKEYKNILTDYYEFDSSFLD